MEQTKNNAELLLKAEGIRKVFSGVKVLNDIDFDVRVGEVHSLVGQNGAGKSTLIKILCGVYPKDSGTIYMRGKPVEINNRMDSMKAGISVVYQEFSLMPNLSVAQNIMIGREETTYGVLKKKKMLQTVQALIDQYEIGLDAKAIVNTLSTAECQMVEILKALSLDCSLLILDEPTASLSYKESQTLFEIIRNLRSKGISVLYISHRLDEVYMLADRITVLRDGDVVGIFESSEIEPGRIISSMIGKKLSMGRKENLKKPTGEKVLEVRHATRQGVFADLNLNVHAGEIVGLGGLVGAGRTELLRAIFGADKLDSGEILFNQKPIKNSIQKNIAAGMGFISEDRLGEGIVPFLSIERNVGMANYNSISTARWIINRSKEKALGAKLIAKMNVRPPDAAREVATLSGGNQQKVVVGKWLFRNTKLLLIDEPTVGVDIGAKAEIYDIIEKLAQEGAAILIVSSDNEELVRISNRILIMRKGRIIREFCSGSPNEEEIASASVGIGAKG